MGMQELEPIETASLDELRSLQTERLRATIRHTYANVAHYRETWDAAGVHPTMSASCPTWPGCR